MLKKILVLAIFLSSSNLFAETMMQKKMLKFIDSISSVYESMYAPAKWKKQFSNWSLDTEVEKAKKQIRDKELTLAEYHKVVNNLILSMKDYHVSVRFFATEKATLPFMVRGAEGRYFIVYIDREKLSKESFPLELGDELTEMGGKKVDEIAGGLKSMLGGNVAETDQALAEMRLTSRSASRGMSVPKGPITLTFKKKDGKMISHQLIWDYEKELLGNPESTTNPPANFVEASRGSDSKSKKSIIVPELNMISDLALDFANTEEVKNTFSLGAKKSFIPELGGKLWSSDKDSHFDAYMYINKNKEVIGYVRIPKYGAGEKESLQFKKIIKKFQKQTDKLVIDQVNNPGGSVFYLYSLVSMLTDQAMATPKHYMSINQETVMGAIESVKELSKIKNLEELKKEFGGKDTLSGYPLSMTFLSFMKSYYQFIVDEWSEGRRLTTPYHLYGVDKINPHPEVSYTKPILLLVNELDFSGGDFFPAIMQDNKRATIMGVRTAGAGGYVIGVEIPNQLAVGGFRYTGSLADRVDNTPIENLGVRPDIDYSLSVKDYQNNFSEFSEKIKEVINALK